MGNWRVNSEMKLFKSFGKLESDGYLFKVGKFLLFFVVLVQDAEETLKLGHENIHRVLFQEVAKDGCVVGLACQEANL